MFSIPSFGQYIKYSSAYCTSKDDRTTALTRSRSTSFLDRFADLFVQSAEMNPYHGIDDPLKRAQAMTHDKQRVTMLKCFRAEIEKLGLVLQPDERRKAMSRLIEEWIPAMEEIGIVSCTQSRRLSWPKLIFDRTLSSSKT